MYLNFKSLEKNFFTFESENTYKTLIRQEKSKLALLANFDFL